MARFIVFTLAAPLASFGGVAGNEVRGSASRPGHSMLAGLLAAALGLKRDDPQLLPLSEGCRFAVRIHESGSPLVDYHTVQSPEGKRFRPSTRRDALAHDKIGTVITYREYRTDVLYAVALSLAGGPFMEEEIVAAVKQPRFVLYAGRKSCPLSLPLHPLVFDAVDAVEAFHMYEQALTPAQRQQHELHSRREARWRNLHPQSKPPRRIAGQAALLGGREGRHERRRARPADRKSWQFTLLDELVLPPEPEPPEPST